MDNNNNGELSALRDNIQKKGNNAYYYAHTAKIDGPVWDNNIEPKLIKTSEKTASSSSEKQMSFASFESFAWVDGRKNVKIYIDFEKADEINDEFVILECISSTIVSFSIKKGEKHYRMVLDYLNDNVENVSVKKKNDKFILTLEKEKESAWYELRKTRK